MLNKEELRQLRKDAYQKAKAKRDADPVYQALKEKQKLERRIKYQAFKAQPKEAKLAIKRKKQKEKDAALMALMVPASSLKQTLENV